VVKLGTRLPTIPCRAVLRFLRDLQRCGDLDSCHDREAGKNPTQRTRTSRPGPRPPGESGSAGQKRSWTPQELLICAHRATHGAKSRRKLESAEQLHSGPFLACPKVYEFRLPTFLTGIVSFQCPYLICEWFMGSHRAREGNARSPPSLIYAGIPLGFPRPPLPPGFFQQLPSIWILIARGSSTAPHTNEKGRPQCRRVVFESLLKRSIAGTARAIAVAA
jgi:hypothetical protein